MPPFKRSQPLATPRASAPAFADPSTRLIDCAEALAALASHRETP
jgi:hypothetical protein